MVYYELSADESLSDNGEECSSSEIDSDNEGVVSSMGKTLVTKRLRVGSASSIGFDGHDRGDNTDNDGWISCVLHLDVDCFYCACEQIDRPNENLNERPFAIGQKHIIVTCNYVARRYGVRKLCSRQEALQKCPSLLIIEGSDLQRYRQYSYRIYQCFRTCLQELSEKYCKIFVPSSSPQPKKNSVRLVSARKGGMDEMFADITQLVNAMEKSSCDAEDSIHCNSPMENYFVYGEASCGNSSHHTILTEDQTGATVTIDYQHDNLKSTGLDMLNSPSSSPSTFYRIQQKQQKCVARLRNAARNVAQVIQERIRSQIGFTTSVGVSISPMLAKLASGTQKPYSINLLYPWRASQLILNMPLRKLPQMGHATYQALESCIFHEYQMQHPHKGGSPNPSQRIIPPFWTCRDLLQVSKENIVKCLKNVRSLEKTSEEYSIRLIEQCNGLDSTKIVDDGGGLTKTVSVENSFRRGTICNETSVHDALTELCMRLPKLLLERQRQSPIPLYAFPTTIRLTTRNLDRNTNHIQNHVHDESDHDNDGKSLLRRTSKWESNQVMYGRIRHRPHITKSKQAPFNGRQLLVKDLDEQQLYLKHAVLPLLQELVVESSTPLSITRMNLAVANFADIKFVPIENSAKTISSGMFCNAHNDTSTALGHQLHCKATPSLHKRAAVSNIVFKRALHQRTDEPKKTPRLDQPSPIKLTSSPRSWFGGNRTIPRGGIKSVETGKQERIDQFFPKKSNIDKLL